MSLSATVIEVLVSIHAEVPATPLQTGTMKMPEVENLRFFDEFSFEQQREETDSLSPSAGPLSMRAKSRRNCRPIFMTSFIDHRGRRGFFPAET